jgi:hypothetical protein
VPEVDARISVHPDGVVILPFDAFSETTIMV